MNDQGTGAGLDDVARARSSARGMSEHELHELHGRGSSAFAPGAWQALDEEVRRRIGARRAFASLEDTETRYPALRIIAFLLKAIAVLVLVVTVIGAALILLQPRLAGITARDGALAGPLAAVLLVAGGLIGAVSYWASAELFVLLMDIEQNTRAMRRN